VLDRLLIESDLHSVGKPMTANDDDRLPQAIARTLESINHLLEEGRVYELDEEKPHRQQRSKVDEALAPSVWMAKRHDVLSLARQCHRVSQKLDQALAAVTFLNK
jgi:hypothetical protein